VVVKEKLVVARQVEMVVLAVAHLVPEELQHQGKVLRVVLDLRTPLTIGAQEVAVVLPMETVLWVDLVVAPRDQLAAETARVDLES
jgi:hypothetical protein